MIAAERVAFKRPLVAPGCAAGGMCHAFPCITLGEVGAAGHVVAMTSESKSPIVSLVAAFAGGLFIGYADLTATEVQGPALVLMIVTFACAFPRRAPGWLIAIVAMMGIPLMHGVAVLT